MPNWCSTTITFSGDSKDVKKLEAELLNAQKAGGESDFKETWLGNLLLLIGFPYEEVCQRDIAHCRGYITDMITNTEVDELTVYTESAWEPALQVFVKFLDHFKLNDIEMIFSAEEPGMGLYLTNDPAEDGNWLFDCWEPEKLPEPMKGWDYAYLPEQQLKDALVKVLGHDGKTAELAGEFEHEFEDCSIHQFEWCEIDECA